MYTVSEKMTQLWNSIAQNYKDRFDDIWQKYAKDSRIEFACFTFHVGLYQLFLFQTGRTPKIMRILTFYQANAPILTPFSKDDKMLIKNLYECKRYNARQFITEFPDKCWTKNSINGLLVKFGTVGRRPGRRSAHTDKNVHTVESLLLSQEDKPQSHRTVREISREAGIHWSSVSRIIHKDLHLKCIRLTTGHRQHFFHRPIFWLFVDIHNFEINEQLSWYLRR